MLRIILSLAMLVAFTVGVASPAMAAPPKPKQAKERTLDFEGDTIEAEYMKPDQMTIEAISHKQNQGFIKIRTDFIKEIVRSAEDL
jgi:hypothetical protein